MHWIALPENQKHSYYLKLSREYPNHMLVDMDQVNIKKNNINKRCFLILLSTVLSRTRCAGVYLQTVVSLKNSAIGLDVVSAPSFSFLTSSRRYDCSRSFCVSPGDSRDKIAVPVVLLARSLSRTTVGKRFETRAFV